MNKIGFNMVGFVGVVEDRMDPEKLGRVRVRCYGFHTEELCNDTEGGGSGEGGSGSKKCIDTDQLPWSIPLQPSVYGTMNGIGKTPSSLVEGTWVFGIFIDGEAAQQPLILGSLPGIPECANPGGNPEDESDCKSLSIQSEGFYDPRLKDNGELDDVPRPPKLINYKKACSESESENADAGSGENKNLFTGHEGQSHNPAQQMSTDEDLAAGVGEVGSCIEETDSGENYPLEGEQSYENRKGTFKDEPDTNRLARGFEEDGDEEKTLVKWKKDNVDTFVPTAAYRQENFSVPEKCSFRVGPNRAKFKEGDCTPQTESLGTEWSEPETPYDARYPYNHVMETESGHVEEWDDTPGAERYHRFHRSGTFTEIHPNGTKVEKIVGERYTIILTNDKIHIEANSDITIDKAAKIYVNADEQCGNHFDIEVGRNSNLNIQVADNVNLHADKCLHLSAGEDITFNAGRDVIWRVAGDVDEHVRGNHDCTVVGNMDLSITGNLTELIGGGGGVLQEIQSGAYTQRIATTSYVISGGLMTEIGIGNITMNPLDRPGSVQFTIPAVEDCTPVARCGGPCGDGGGDGITENPDLQ